MLRQVLLQTLLFFPFALLTTGVGPFNVVIGQAKPCSAGCLSEAPGKAEGKRPRKEWGTCNIPAIVIIRQIANDVDSSQIATRKIRDAAHAILKGPLRKMKVKVHSGDMGIITQIEVDPKEGELNNAGERWKWKIKASPFEARVFNRAKQPYERFLFILTIHVQGASKAVKDLEFTFGNDVNSRWFYLRYGKQDQDAMVIPEEELPCGCGCATRGCACDGSCPFFHLRISNSRGAFVLDAKKRLATGSNAFDVLRGFVQVRYETFPKLGPTVTGLCGLDAPPGYFWALYVDGKLSAEGVGGITLSKNTLHEWKLQKIQAR